MPSPGFALARTLEGHSKSVAAVKFSPDGSLVASASADKTVRLWRVADGAQLCVLVGHERGCSDVAWTGCGRYLASASDDKNLHLWDVDPCSPHYGKTVRVFAGHTSHVFCCDVNSVCGANNVLASGSVDETVRLWDLRQGTCVNVLPAHSDPVTGVKFSPDGAILATCSYDGITRLWSVATGACLRTIVLGLGGGGLGGGGGGGGGAEGAEGAEDADTAGDKLAVIPGFVGNAVDDVAALADGVVINGGAGWGDGSYRNAPIGCIVPSTNGRYLLASTLDAHGSLRLWDAVKGRVVRTYAGRRGSRYCAFAAFADAEGTSYAVCGSEDGSVMAWDLRTGEVAQRIPGSDAAWTNVVGDERTKAEAEKRRGSEKAENTAKLDGDGIEPATGSPGTPGRDEEDGDAGNRVGAPGREGKDGDGGDAVVSTTPPPPTDPNGHDDAVVGLDFFRHGMLATSGLERDRTIKLWTTAGYRERARAS